MSDDEVSKRATQEQSRGIAVLIYGSGKAVYDVAFIRAQKRLRARREHLPPEARIVFGSEVPALTTEYLQALSEEFSKAAAEAIAYLEAAVDDPAPPPAP